MCRQIELIPADRVHAPAPWTAQRERMPARRRAVPAAGTGEVAITPVSWEAYRIAGAEHDGPAPRWDGDGFQQRARQRDRRSVHVEHDALVGDPNVAVPRAAAQPAIYVTLETSPLQLVGDCPMFRLWYRRPEDSPPRRRSQVSSARYTATVTLEATPVRAQSAARDRGPSGDARPDWDARPTAWSFVDLNREFGEKLCSP